MSIDLRSENDGYDLSRARELISKPGCLVWFLALLLFVGILVIIVFIVAKDDPETPGPINAVTNPTPSVTATTPAANCEDATAAFRAAGGSQLVQRVCWEPTGRLRAEANLTVDVVPGSASMRALCTSLSDFVTGSGKDWNGFTVYSTHQISPGQAVLTSSQSGQCARPS